ncbi:hypothetical protein E2C01_095211 [Portunus trituberculatus]|uniref:Uncharacterized protein n=1 Tax=Portunus trituberculatus TaxID=210409 RepID=A0A5B7JZL6_PORTR|nr:hypothetical protein [Portunus trituberculatus]
MNDGHLSLDSKEGTCNPCLSYPLRLTSSGLLILVLINSSRGAGVVKRAWALTAAAGQGEASVSWSSRDKLRRRTFTAPIPVLSL